MTLVASGGIIATLAAWLDWNLLLSLLAAAGVIIIAMRTADARRRLAPVLVVLVGLSITVAASARIVG